MNPHDIQESKWSMIILDIKRIIKANGIERTEEIIKDTYKHNITLREQYLMVYKGILNIKKIKG